MIIKKIVHQKDITTVNQNKNRNLKGNIDN